MLYNPLYLIPPPNSFFYKTFLIITKSNMTNT